ncbi:MAG: protein kinase [Myxococcales bacterium]
MAKPTLGSIVGGKYKLLRALGEGGMGTVYEVEHALTHKRAAIKWVHPQMGSSDSAHDRLLHEARATSRIHHRNVVDVYDVLREDVAVCLVMQLLVGEPLSDLIARGPMPLSEFVALLLPAMRGVAAAHAAGVIHRDIKPDNIFLAQEPGQSEIVPKVIDFGISKVFDPKASNHTRSGITMGTPKYVSYEQLLGARDVDARADVYAFGVMLYEAITGEPPYRAGTFGEQAVAFAMSVPARPVLLRPDLPPALDTLVYRAIAKDREHRIRNIEALIAELEQFADAKAYPVPMQAFAEPVPPFGTLQHDDPTSPAVVTPSSQPRDSLPEVSRLSPTPSAPAPVVPVASTSRRPRVRLTSLIVFACAAGLLGLLVWWFQVPNHQASLPAARAESAPTTATGARAPSPGFATSPAPSGIGPSSTPEPTSNPNESELLPSRANAMLPTTSPATVPSAVPLLGAPPPAASKQPVARRQVPPIVSKAPARDPSESAPVAPREAVDTPKSDASGNETHRAGRLGRDEF